MRNIAAGMATMPGREAQLDQAIRSLLPQVDALFVYCNGMQQRPLGLTDPALYWLCATVDRTDAGKFFCVPNVTGYFLSVDDDIIYPPDYVATMIDAVERYQRRAIVGVHGVVLRPPVTSYYRCRQVYHGAADIAEDMPVHILGTGTVAFHTSAVTVPRDGWPVCAADIYLGILAQQQRVPMVCLAHTGQWLQILPCADTIYARYGRNDTSQTALVASVPHWEIWL